MKSFEVVINRITVDENCVTLDVFPATKVPPGARIPDSWCEKQRGWFAGLNDEANETVRIAFHGDDGRDFRAGGRLKITLEPLP